MRCFKLAVPVFITITITITLALSPCAGAETLHLKTGKSIVGDVALQDGDALVVHVRFPEEARIVLGYDELTSSSLYGVLERRIAPDDVPGRRRLAEVAADAGLYGPAIAEYRALKALDAEQAEFADSQIRLLTEAIAAEALQKAEELLEDDNPAAAIRYLHVVTERYSHTEAAKKAKKLMPEAHRRAGESSEIARKTVASDQVDRVLGDIARELAKGDGERDKVRGHEGRIEDSSKQRRALDRAIHWYEKAWSNARRLPVAADPDQLRSRIEEVRHRVKDRLVSACLAAASIQLQRRSIPKAEDYCNRACQLSPDSKENHATHRLILEAKAYGR